MASLWDFFGRYQHACTIIYPGGSLSVIQGSINALSFVTSVFSCVVNKMPSTQLFSWQCKLIIIIFLYYFFQYLDLQDIPEESESSAEAREHASHC